MSEWKNKAAWGLGYAGFFLFFFVIFLFATFDTTILASRISKEAKNSGVNLDIGDISISPALSVTLAEVEIAPQPRVKNTEGLVPMKFDRIKISPKLTRLPAVIIAAIRGKQPPAAFSFGAVIGNGKLNGSFDQGLSSLYASLDIDNLPLESVTLPGYYMEGIKLFGSVKSLRFELNIDDMQKPDDWTGGLNLTLDGVKVSDFTFYGYQVVGFQFKPGGLVSASIKGGIADIKGIKIDGDIAPDLKGQIALKNPVGESVIDIKGKLTIDEDYKSRMPTITMLIPDSENYTFNGQLHQIVPSLRPRRTQ